MSIILTETPQKLTANSNSDPESPFSPNPAIDNFNSRIDLLGISAIANNELEEPSTSVEEPAAETYHYF